MSMFHKFFGRENVSQTAKKTRNSLVNLSIEPLEERQMLSINPLIVPLDSVQDILSERGGTAEFALTVNSGATAAIGINITANEGGDFDPSSIRVFDADNNQISPLYDFNGTKTSTVVANLPSGNYRIEVDGENNSYGSFTCDVFMPGVKELAEDGSALVSKTDALRVMTAAAQGSGNYNEQTIAYYNALAASLGIPKSEFNAAQNQYGSIKFADVNNDQVISASESSWVTTNSKAGKVTAAINASEAITVSAGVTNWLVSDTAATKTKTAILDISGTASSNVVKLEAIFEGTGAQTSWTDITSKLGSVANGVKSFNLDAATLNSIYYGNTTGSLSAGTYTIKFRASSGDDKQTPVEISYTFTLVDHDQPVSHAPASQTLYPVNTGSSVEWNVADLVENPGTTFSYAMHSVTAYGTTYTFTLNATSDGYTPITITNGGVAVGTLSYTGGTKGADGHFYGGKLVFNPTAAQVALSKGAENIGVTFTFVVRDDSAILSENKTDDDKSIHVTVVPVNKTPVVNLDGVKTTFNVGDAEYAYQLTGTSNSNSAVIATDANTGDVLSFGSVTVNGTALTTSNPTWTSAQGTVITLVGGTELKITPTSTTGAASESIAIVFTVKDNAGVTTAANGDQVSETAPQTLTISVGIAAPSITGDNMSITAAQAGTGNINMTDLGNWRVISGSAVTSYRIGTSEATLGSAASLGDTTTISGVGTFRLNADGTLTWLTVDSALIPAAGTQSKGTNFVLQATNAQGTTTSQVRTLTVTADSNVVFGPQTLYLPTNGVAVDGRVSTGMALTYDAPTGTSVAYTILSATYPNGSAVESPNSIFTFVNGRITVSETALASLAAGEYKLQVQATFTGAANETRTAEITLNIGQGTPAILTPISMSLNENTTDNRTGTVSVNNLGSVGWAVVANSVSLENVTISVKNGVNTNPLTAADLASLEGKMTVTVDGNVTFAPGSNFSTLFAFLSQGQTATLEFTYEVREDRYGLVSTGTINVTVGGVNQLPSSTASVTVNTPAQAIAVDDEDGIHIPIASLQISDPDLADTHLLVVNGTELNKDGSNAVTLDSGATVKYVVNAAGDYLLYVPNGDDEASPFYSERHNALIEDEFTLYVKDDSGATATNPTTVTVNLKGVNKRPAFDDEEAMVRLTTEDGHTPIVIGIDDIDIIDPNDGDTHTFGTIYVVDESDAEVDLELAPGGSTTTPTGSTVSLSADGKTLTIVPSTTEINLRKDVSRSESYRFTVKDDSTAANSESLTKKDLELTVIGVNEAPTATAIPQTVEENKAFTAWYTWNDELEKMDDTFFEKWVKIDWQDKIHDADGNGAETNMLSFMIFTKDGDENGYKLDFDEVGENGISVAYLSDGSIFVLRMEAGELVIRFRPDKDYSYLANNVLAEPLEYEIQAIDPIANHATDPIVRESGSSARVDFVITIKGEATTTPTAGNGIQTFYVSEDTPTVAFRPVRFFIDKGISYNLDDLEIRGTIEGIKDKNGVPFSTTFTGFELIDSPDGLVIEITPDANLVSDFGANPQDGDKLIYKVPIQYHTGSEYISAGFVYVSVLWGPAPIIAAPVDYELTVSEKHLADKDRPYTPAFPEGYSVGITGITPSGVFSTTNPVTSEPELLSDAVAALVSGKHYGFNEDGRFWFNPNPEDFDGNLFYFLRQDQEAIIVFNFLLHNEYGLPGAGASGTITVTITGVNDRPEFKTGYQDAYETLAHAKDGTSLDTIKIYLKDLISDRDVDDTHSLLVSEEIDGVWGEQWQTLSSTSGPVRLANGAALIYGSDAGGAYIRYISDGNNSDSPFYQLQSQKTLANTVRFKAQDNSNMANSVSTAPEAVLTFTVKGVNKTPVAPENQTQTVDSDASITIYAGPQTNPDAVYLATDANTDDSLSFVSIQYGSNTAWTSAGTHEIRGTYKGTADVVLGTLVIAANMQSFTFTPSAILLDPENGLTPYSPSDPNSFLDLEFTFVVKDNQGIGADNTDEQQSEMKDAAILNLQIQGVSQGPRLFNTDYVGSIANNSTEPRTRYLEASVFFSGKNVKFTDVKVVSAIPPDDLELDPGHPLTFLQNIRSLTVDESTGKIRVDYMPGTQYHELYNLAPVELEVTVEDEDGETATETIYLFCKEQYTTTVYIMPSLVSLRYNRPSDFNVESFPDVTEFDGKTITAGKANTFDVAVGETYYLQIWARDNANELLQSLNETVGLSIAYFDVSFDSSVVSINTEEGVPDVLFIPNASVAQQGTIVDGTGTNPNEKILSNVGCGGPIGTNGLGISPKGWVILQIAVTAEAAGTPDFNVLLEGIALGVDRLKPEDVIQKGMIDNSQVEVFVPEIRHVGAPLTALSQKEQEVAGGIYMRTVTTPTQTLADGTVAALPDDVNMLHEWQTHYVELWVKASEAHQYTAAKTDLYYDTRYFTATNVELGQDFRYGDRAVIDDALGMVSGIGGSSSGSVSKDGYILLGRVQFQSIGTDNVPWKESAVPHSLGLKLDGGGVRMSEGYWVSKLGTGSKTELWANPYDSNDDGKVSLVDFTAFAKEFVFMKEGVMNFSPFNVSRSGRMSPTDFTCFSASFGTTREKVAAGEQVLKLHGNYTKRYVGSTLQTDNQALVGMMLDAANQAWADALGLDKPINVTLVVKDFGDSPTLGEAQITAIDANGLPSAGIITLDNDAAGFGWYSQIAEPVNASKYDLYTTLVHELGHIYGINEAYAAYNAVKPQFAGQIGSSGHILDPDDVMYEGLYTGERKYVSDLDVLLLQTVYGQAKGNSALHGFSNTPMRLEALGDKVVETAVVEVVVATFAASDVAVESAVLTVAVAKESALPAVLKTEENAKTLAELNMLGLDVSLPQVTPNYSVAANADLILGDLWADDADEFDLLAGPVAQQAEKSELLDQLIADIF